MKLDTPLDAIERNLVLIKRLGNSPADTMQRIKLVNEISNISPQAVQYALDIRQKMLKDLGIEAA